MNLFVRPDVYADLEEVLIWYDEIDQHLSDRLETEFDKILELLENSPTRFARVYQDFRRAKLSDFPYHVYYKVNQSKVVVVLFIHTSRNPKVIGRLLRKRK